MADGQLYVKGTRVVDATKEPAIIEITLAEYEALPEATRKANNYLITDDD